MVAMVLGPDGHENNVGRCCFDAPQTQSGTVAVETALDFISEDDMPLRSRKRQILLIEHDDEPSIEEAVKSLTGSLRDWKHLPSASRIEVAAFFQTATHFQVQKSYG